MSTNIAQCGAAHQRLTGHFTVCVSITSNPNNKLQALVYNIILSDLEEGAGKRCLEYAPVTFLRNSILLNQALVKRKYKLTKAF